MNCFSCKRKGNLNHNGRDYCNSCFCKLIERRVGKYIRANKFFEANDSVLVKDPLTEYVLNRILKGMPLKFVKRKIKGVKEVVQWTLDDEIHAFLKSFFSKAFTLAKVKGIKLFKVVTDDELKTYAQIKKLKFEPRKKEKFFDLITELEKKYPEIRFSLSKSLNELREVLK
ncbi:hypothetical protein KY330_03160 [Candidatus Woesearchaeota archaeon]|nr:hypothetical protein [Candidatus Woesearchaeota archaeon]